jgi:hypothetical protein
VTRALVPLYTPDAQERRQREQIADALPRPGLLDPTIRTQDFTAVPGGTYRIAGAAVRVMLPQPAPELFGKTVTLFLESGAASVWQAGVSDAIAEIAEVGVYDFRCSLDGWRNNLDPVAVAAAALVGGVPGRLLAVRAYSTAGSGTHTHATGTTRTLAYFIGGGGGGGGVDAGAGGGAGGGGSSGAVRLVDYVPGATTSYTVGAGGAGGVAAAAPAAGGSSSVGGYGAAGGNPGTSVVAAAAVVIGEGGNQTAVPPTVDTIYSAPGAAGSNGVYYNAAGTAQAGNGGPSPLGGMARGRASNGDGVSALGPGGGGAGARQDGGATDRTGGAGADGIVIFADFGN